MEPFQYPPEPEYVYSIKNTWDNYFVEYFPWLVREMYNILPILFSDVPAGLWREIANMGAIATPNIGASFAASFAKLTSYLSEVDYDIDKLVNLNFWLRVVLAFLEGWFFFFVVCLQKVQDDAEAATQLVAARVADLEGDLGLGEDLAGGGGGVMGEVREGLFADMVGYGCLRANDCIGGFDQKSSGKDMERPVAQEDVLVFAQGYARFLEQLWFAKKRSVLEELCENCRMGADDGALQGVNLNVGLVLRLGTELAKRYPDFFKGDQRFASAAVAFVSAFLYTMQDVDIDRTHLFNDVPSFPVGEESPAARDMVYKPYRAKLKDSQVERNPQMFQTACGATRQRWDIYSKEREQENESMKLADSDEEQKQQHAEKVAADAQWKATVETELTKWVKWVTLLGVMRQPLPNVTTSRGLCGLPPFIIESLMQKKPGDSIFWAAMSSTTLDSSISESYANQAEPVDRNILFTIENITEGLALHSISMYPKEKEILLPPLTLLKVKEATPPETDPPKPGRIVCEFDGCYLTDRLQRACEEDLAECTALLEAAARASAAEQRPKNGLIGKATGAKPGKVAPA
ncbi:unnamed protein product [Prorocentrum cordatum]|uniref:Mono(ADP-ribosyl)transferase n=1 Tax=Prorocentrum cordatum TaxID=2364126 RepID=A0ABN9YAS5_9DINO|nr:unnamed protein product [Polarella glacialis]